MITQNVAAIIFRLLSTQNVKTLHHFIANNNESSDWLKNAAVEHSADLTVTIAETQYESSADIVVIDRVIAVSDFEQISDALTLTGEAERYLFAQMDLSALEATDREMATASFLNQFKTLTIRLLGLPTTSETGYVGTSWVMIQRRRPLALLYIGDSIIGKTVTAITLASRLDIPLIHGDRHLLRGLPRVRVLATKSSSIWPPRGRRARIGRLLYTISSYKNYLESLLTVYRQ